MHYTILIYWALKPTEQTIDRILFKYFQNSIVCVINGAISFELNVWQHIYLCISIIILYMYS